MNIGDIINYQINKKQKHKGIITQIVEPYEDSHGMIEVWLYSTTGYGLNNCEHFSYDCFKEEAHIIKSKNSNTEIGDVIETELGLGMIVEIENKDYKVFLYDQPNDYIPHDHNIGDNVEEFEDLDLQYTESGLYKDQRFDEKTHCIILKENEIIKK